MDDYDDILKQQNYKCAICKKPYEKENRRLSIDHNHKTGYIRGLLCNFCNSRLLRMFMDNKERTQSIIDYFNKAIKEDKKWE